MNRKYLGDGAYVDDEGFQIRLWTDRSDGVHEVYLDSDALLTLFQFLERSRGLTIEVRKTEQLTT
jgi:hypothetical protein